jgi:uncharacterized damage-inducible protein DinB
MTTSALDDAFAHHVWATLRLIDACLSLAPEQLEAGVPGTYGSILETIRHVVRGDSQYISHLSGDPDRQIDTEHMDLRALRAAVETEGRAWIKQLARGLDPGTIVKDVDEGGYARDASIGLRLAQALQHGNDHRSQICTALTTLGVEPPAIDVWAYGYETGRAIDTPPAS